MEERDQFALYALPYGVFIIALLAMTTIGWTLQQWDMHLGLVLSELICILLPAIIFRTALRDMMTSIRIDRIGARIPTILLIIVTAAFVGLLANLLAGVVVEFVPALKPNAVTYEAMVNRLLRPDETWRAVVGISSVCIVAPLCEEMLFRGTVLPLQLTQRRLWTVLFINGVLFSAVHLNPMGFVALVVVGVFFAHVAYLTKSVWPSVLAHAVLNTINGVVVPLAIAGRAEAERDPELWELAAGLGVVLPIVAVLWFLLVRSLASRPDTEPTDA